jgi:hypothetical protein
MRNRFYLIAAICSVVFVIVTLLTYNHNKTSEAVIEGKSGPYVEMGAQLNGLIQLGGDKVLISSRKQGLYTYSPKEHWNKLIAFSDIGEITAIADIDNDIVVSTKDNKIIRIHKRDVELKNDRKFRTVQLSESFYKILKCGDKLIGLSSDGIFEVDGNHTNKYQVEGTIPQTADCHNDQMLVGTRTTGTEFCSIKARTCHRSIPKFPYPDARGILWDSDEKAWFAGQYGTPFGFNVLKLVNNKWVPVGSYLGDVTAFFKDAKGHFKYVLTEKGRLFEYENNKFKTKDIKENISPYFVEISNKKFYAISFGSLISLENREIKNHGMPILLEKIDDKQKYGNTYVWDIDIVDKNVIFAETSQIGIWWSSNGGTSWQEINNGLGDLKVHFVKYNKKYNQLIAGTHSQDLYTCSLPCKKWTPLGNKNVLNADFQGIVAIDEDRYALATKAGVIIYNLAQNRIEKKVSLPCRHDELGRVAQFWLINNVDGQIFAGIYPIPADCPTGVWRLDNSLQLKKAYDINEAISGIVSYKGSYYISTLNTLYKCNDTDCTTINKLMINRITLSGNILWLATARGIGFIDLDKDNKQIKWVLNIPAQIVKVLDEQKHILLVGTLNSGVLRVRIK